MPLYRYTARTRTGQAEQGTVDAVNEDEAASQLLGRELLITSLGPATSSTPRSEVGASGRQARAARRTKVIASDLVTFGRAMATMIDAGLPLLKSLETITPQIESKLLRDAVQEISQDIRAGNTFREAVAKHPKIFSKLWVGIIETGEASGQLTKALEQITLHLEKSGAVQRKVVSALAYPAILICVSCAAILVFVLKIIPTFGNLFASFGAELPLITQIVLKFSTFVKNYALLILASTATGLFFFWRYAKTETGRWEIDGVLLRTPILGQIVQGAAMASFATSLSTMIKAGVPILHGLEITISATMNTRVAHVLEQMRTGAREGRSLAEPLRNSEVFPAMVTQMVSVGEETGKLANMLDEIAKYYEEQVSTLLERLTSLIEPLLLISMGTIIGFLVIAMYLPIFFALSNDPWIIAGPRRRKVILDEAASPGPTKFVWGLARERSCLMTSLRSVDAGEESW